MIVSSWDRRVGWLLNYLYHRTHPLYHYTPTPPSLCVFGSPPRDRTRIQGSIDTIFYGVPTFLIFHLHFLSLYQSYVNTFVPYMVLCVSSIHSFIVYLEQSLYSYCLYTTEW
jgi:hypothetical protein